MKKHWNKQLLALLLALLMLVLSVPFAAAEDSNIVLHTAAGEDGYWELNNEGRLTIAGSGEMPYPQDSAIDLWRDVIDQIRILDIRAGITSIPEDSFYRCSTIEQVLLPDTLISIGNYAFFMLTDMERLTIPENVKTIGRFAFDGCASLKELVIPKGVQTIEERAFEFCLSLESIHNYSPTAVTTNCETFRLKETDFWTRERIIDVARWLAETGYMAMAPFNDTQESQITAEMMQSFNTRFGTDLTAAEYLSLIQDVSNTGAADNPTVYCFSDSAEKQSCIEKGYNYRTIGETLSGQCGDDLYWSFDDETCSMIVSGTGPMWNKAINTDADTWEGPENAVTNGEWKETEAEKWASVSNQVTTIKFEDGVTAVGAGLFFDWSSNNNTLQNVILADSVLEIGKYAFSGCIKLTDLKLSNSLRTIGEEAFSYCYTLPEVIFPESLETICEGAFYQCVALKEIVIPEHVEKIEGIAFSDSPYLDKITVLGKNTVLEENALGIVEWRFENLTREQYLDWTQTLTEDELLAAIEPYEVHPNPNDPDADYSYYGTIYCYSGSTAESYAQQNNMDYQLLDEEIMPNQCGDDAFWSYDAETATLTVSGTDSTWEIVSNDENIYQAETVVVEEGITEIGHFTFDNFRNVRGIRLPDSLISIGARAFDSTFISEFNVPKNVADISEHAFEFCGNIEKFIVTPENETYSSDDFGCLFNKDKTVLVRYATGRHGDYTVPDSVKTIAYGAFQNAWYLDHVTLGSSVRWIEAYAFFQSTLKSITLPDGVERIEHEAFWRCGLSQVTLPASVEYIGYECFHECGLESITILNPDCVIECTPVGTESEGKDCGDKTIPSPIIYGYPDSSAQRFAETYDRVLIDVTKETVLDADTGVAVTYDADAFDPDVQIRITELPTGNENSRSWDITPTLNGTKVQPKKPVQVRLPIPAEWDKSGIIVAHVDENGNKTYPAFTIEGDFVVFWASAFSEYLLEQKTPHTHDYTDHETITKFATCTEAGEKQCFCVCGESIIVGIDPLGHNIVHHDAKAPTCTESGCDAYDTCSRCDYTTFAEQATLGHLDENNDGKCDTCGEKMTGGKHCPQCGKIHNKGFIDKLTGFFHKIAYRLTHLFKK